MLILSVLLIIHQICNYGRTDASQTCDDCIEYTLCPGAVEASNTQTVQSANLFKKGYCGFNVTPTGPIPKVCCSVFTTKEEKIPSISARKLDLLPEECGPIYGIHLLSFRGSRACMYEFPWMALISYRTREGLQFQCSGSIINSRYILTAAHCVDGKNIAGVRVGEYRINTPVDCQEDSGEFVCESHLQDITVAEKIVHENYTNSIFEVTNDIALLRVRKEINFNYQNVHKICLPNTDKLRNSNINGSRGTVTGWGITETGHGSNVLLKIDIPILPDDECHNMYDRRMPAAEESKVSNSLINNEFCAGELGKDSCKGDSGGPFTMEGEYNGALRNIQYGIVSRGPLQCGSRFPGIYTDVRKHMDWIIDNLKP